MRNLYLIILFLFASCEYGYNYTYTVHNHADTAIVVKLISYNLDTTVIISSNTSEKILVTGHGIEGKGGPHFEDVSVDLHLVTVSKRDSLSKRNYYSNSAWTFTKASGTYSTTVTNEEFLPE